MQQDELLQRSQQTNASEQQKSGPWQKRYVLGHQADNLGLQTDGLGQQISGLWQQISGLGQQILGLFVN